MQRLRQASYYLISFVLLPLAALAAFEGGLRLTGYGHSTSYFVAREYESQRFLTPNLHYYQQFFSGDLESMWSGSEWPVVPEKPEGAFRIFVFGGSAGQGWPNQDLSFWRVLQVMLEQRHPGTVFEFYCPAMSGCNSLVMWGAAEACADLDPDAYLVYIGNNEINGPFGAVYWPSRLPGETPAPEDAQRALHLNQYRAIQWARSWWGSGLAYAAKAVGQKIHSGDPVWPAIQQHFRSHLSAIADAAARAGAATILSTVLVNERHMPPIESLNRPGLPAEALAAWTVAYGEGESLTGQSRHAEALEAFGRAAAIDETHAMLRYRMAETCLALERFEEARLHFFEANRHDGMRSRTSPMLNEVIRELATEGAERGIGFVDAEKTLRVHSPHGIPGAEFFYDGAHFNQDGNYRLAAAFLPEVEKFLRARGLGAPVIDAVPSQAECFEILGASDASRLNNLRGMMPYLESWNVPIAAELSGELANLESRIGSGWPPLAAEGFRKSLALRPVDFAVRAELLWTLLYFGGGTVEEMAAEAAELQRRHPMRRNTWRLSAIAFERAGDTAAERSAYERGLRVYPEDGELRIRYGLLQGKLLQEQGDLQRALEIYLPLLKQNPNLMDTYWKCQALMEQLWTSEQRIAFWEKHAGEFAESQEAQSILGFVYVKEGMHAEAIGAFERVLALNPMNSAAMLELGLAQLNAGHATEARASLLKAMEAYPADSRPPALLEGMIRAHAAASDIEGVRAVLGESAARGLVLPPEILKLAEP